MTTRITFQLGKQLGGETIGPVPKRWIMTCAIASAVPLIAQNAELQQKVAAVKQSVAENKRRLQQYQWTETTQLTLKGDAKPPSQSLCQYGAGGQVQKSPISAAPPPPSGGRIVNIVADPVVDKLIQCGRLARPEGAGPSSESSPATVVLKTTN
jgi:hypothetical protein